LIERRQKFSDDKSLSYMAIFADSFTIACFWNLDAKNYISAAANMSSKLCGYEETWSRQLRATKRIQEEEKMSRQPHGPGTISRLGTMLQHLKLLPYPQLIWYWNCVLSDWANI